VPTRSDLFVVVFMLAAGTAMGLLLFVRLATARYVTSAHQLRHYLLQQLAMRNAGSRPHTA